MKIDFKAKIFWHIIRNMCLSAGQIKCIISLCCTQWMECFHINAWSSFGGNAQRNIIVDDKGLRIVLSVVGNASTHICTFVRFTNIFGGQCAPALLCITTTPQRIALVKINDFSGDAYFNWYIFFLNNQRIYIYRIMLIYS